MQANARRRRVAIGLAVAAAILFARCHWDRLTAPQAAPSLFDSQVYREIAARPLGPGLLFSAKPPTVPLVYRATGEDPVTIGQVQGELAFAAWAVLTATVTVALRRRSARAAAVGIGIAFLLAAPRIGWTDVVLSESIDDTLMALVAACAIGLAILARRPARRAPTNALAVITGVVGLAWLFARDTNAIAGLVALVAAALIWPARRWWTTRRWAVVLAGVTTAAAGVALWSTRVVPEPLPFQRSWAVSLTSRAGYPMIDNILIRVMSGDRAWLAERGAPLDVLAAFADPEPRADKLVQRAPELAATQAWIVDDGATTYLRWLARHPLDRLGELVHARWTVLAGAYPSTMPIGWVAHDATHPAVDLLRRLTTSRWILLALLAASPLLLRRPRADPLAGIALCLVASGVVAAAAAYYGDAVELARHCYGAGQQIVLGLFLAALAWLDRARWALPWRPRTPSEAPPGSLPPAPALPR
jgi:hypothetical protein